MPEKSHANTNGIVVVFGGTGVDTGVRVNAGFQSLVVYVLCQSFHAAGETLRMGEEVALGVAAAEKAIVGVDVVVTLLMETKSDHGVGLGFDDVF